MPGIEYVLNKYLFTERVMSSYLFTCLKVLSRLYTSQDQTYSSSMPLCILHKLYGGAEEVFVQLIGKRRLLQYKRQLLVCKLVEKKSQLQAQIESSARKTLKFPETK